MFWGIIILLLGTGVMAAPYVIEARRRPVEADRTLAVGDFAELTQGVTHYRWTGQSRGPVAVLVHGLTTPSFVWTPLAEELGAMGFQVLRYDLYGRGFSDRPGGPQDSEFFIRQLEDFLAYQGLREDVTLIGYSMGGAIASAFAARHPEKIRRLVLIASAGMEHEIGVLPAGVWDKPILSKWLMLLGFARHTRRQAVLGPEATAVQRAMAEGQLEELERRGYIPAVWSSLQGILSEDMEPAHREIARLDIPVLALWGERDETIPERSIDLLGQWNWAARQITFQDAAHDMVYTHHEDIAAVLAKEFERK